MLGKILVGTVGSAIAVRLLMPNQFKRWIDAASYKAGGMTARQAIKMVKAAKDRPPTKVDAKGNIMDSARSIAKSQFARGAMDETLKSLDPNLAAFVGPMMQTNFVSDAKSTIANTVKQLRKIKL